MLGRTRIGLATALVSVLALPGCGGDDENEEKRLRTAYAQLQDRFEARDSKGVCARISKAAREQVGSLGHAQPTTCARDVRQLFKGIEAEQAKPVAQPKAMSIAVDGDRATVTARLSENARGRVRFVEEDGEWKLDSFFGITGPPPPDML